jgi:hypothetical protein
MQHIRSPVPRPALRTDEERDLFAVIERLLAKEPGDRFGSGEEAVAALAGHAPAARAGGARTPGAPAVSPTRPAQAVASPSDPGFDDPGFDDPSGPKPSAALDRAFEVGLALIRRQAPKVGGGLRALKAQRSRANGAMQAARAAVVRVADVAGQARVYVASRSRRFWGGVAAVSVLVVGSYYGVHFATKHQSRCPVVDDAPAIALQGEASDETAPAAPTRKRTFSVLVDAVGTREAGADLEVYYDVCGLDEGTAYTTTVTLTKTESGLRRLLGSSVDPIKITYDETARGPASRRHRTLDLEHMPPGSYWLGVVVRDAAGRRRSSGVGLRLSKP